jgi:polyhydroxyalkanoate synthase subunit PhaC
MTNDHKKILNDIKKYTQEILRQLIQEDENLLLGLKDMFILTRSFSRVLMKTCSEGLKSPELLIKSFLDIMFPSKKNTETPKAFKHPAWNTLPFSLYKNAYQSLKMALITHIEALPHLSHFEKKQSLFFLHVFFEVIAPYHHVLTNPQLLALTREKKGMNLLQGFSYFLEDLTQWQGYFAVTRSDSNKYIAGENIATTRGSVVYQNDLIELLSYPPQGEQQTGIPLLLVTSWVNKYYILDIKQRYSFVYWLSTQGFHVYTLSWNMPDKSCESQGFEYYIQAGVLSAIDQILSYYPHQQCHVVGYCLGGTLLATASAYLAKTRPHVIASLSLCASMLDFSEGGEMKYLLGNAQIEVFEKSMSNAGLWNGRKMATAFNLIDGDHYYWPFYQRRYLEGLPPVAQELVAWLQDYTHSPKALFTFYMKSLYQDNLLIKKNAFFINQVGIDFSAIECPVYCLGLEADHLTPAQAAYDNVKLFKEATFVLGDEGHVIGMLSMPTQKRLGYRINGNIKESSLPEWAKTSQHIAGSWWLHWLDWIHKANKIPKMAYPFETPHHYPPAPGKYVLKKHLYTQDASKC